MATTPALPVSPTRGVPPLFVKHSTFISPVGGLDICLAVEKVTGKETVEGVQRMGDLYRIYLKNQQARDMALVNGITIDNCAIALLSHNPFQVRDQNNTTKIFIGNVPLSVDDSEIERALLDQGIVFKSGLKFETYRTPDGKWTHFKTGRRFIYTEIPKLNLNHFLKIGLWRASIFYKEQTRPTKTIRVDPPLPPPADFASAVSDSETSPRPINQPVPTRETGTGGVAESENISGEEFSNGRAENHATPLNSGQGFFPVFSKKDEDLLNESRGKGETSANGSKNKNTGSRGRSPVRRSLQHRKISHWSKSTSRSVSNKRKKSSTSPNSISNKSGKTPKHNSPIISQVNSYSNSQRS